MTSASSSYLKANTCPVREREPVSETQTKPAMPLPTLRDYRAETVEMVCTPCARQGVFSHKSLVKKFGANAEFVQIRRVLAMGCEHAGTEKCRARFPCLLQAHILWEPRR